MNDCLKSNILKKESNKFDLFLIDIFDIIL